MNNEKLIDKAKRIATYAHEGQTRKGSGSPYITHPIAVAKLVEEQGARDEVIAATFLHDVLEDVDDQRYSEADLLRDFGDDVLTLVKGVSEQKVDESGNAIKWHDRKEAYIKNVQNGSDEVVLISLADKVHNLSSILKDYLARGDVIWERFNSTPAEQLWYYSTLLQSVFLPRFGSDHKLVKQLQELVDQFVEVFHLENEVSK